MLIQELEEDKLYYYSEIITSEYHIWQVYFVETVFCDV